MRKSKDLTFTVPANTTLFVYLDAGSRNGRRHWWCYCFGLCGGTIMTKAVSAQNLRSGNTSSCGCLRKRVCGDRSRTHGMRNDPRYPSWCQMRYRCNEPKNAEYTNYGGRGIKVCARWQGKEGFPNFCADMGDRPDGHTIERRKVNGNYEPSNCLWIPHSEQAYNKRNTVWYTYNGVSKPVAKWAKEYGMVNQTLKHRLLVLEMTFTDAVNTEVAPRSRTFLYGSRQMLISEIAEAVGLTKGCLTNRIRRAGIPENGSVEGVIHTLQYDTLG
jgi:hypothetical protein